MTLFNIQKLNNLVRNSYSIAQCPSLKKLFDSGYSYKLDSVSNYIDEKLLDNPDNIYLSRLSTLSRPDKSHITSSGNINWYAFRYNFKEYKENMKKNYKTYVENERERLKEDLGYKFVVEGIDRG